MPSFKRALVIGASSGIGKALARQLLSEGCHVAFVSRRPSLTPEEVQASNGHAFVYEHDVRNYLEAPELFQRIARDLGGLDLVIYSSGVMPAMDEHEYSFDKDREIIDVNVLGAFAWLDEAARRFEQLKSKGMIMGISSVAGERGRRGNPAYCTSKAALTTYLESLRNRLGRYGIKVLTVKPGFVATEMTEGKPGLFWVITAEDAARRILRAARAGKNTAYIPKRWRYVSFLLKSVPSFLFRRLPI
ncbi:MAG TPA: SDR family NAD(P)-dependent oxidoreductase [Candidatus Kapabacteria bacterium]|jgi:NAD(P)-dependent dehydrogenase (short-subunit alcohol dehydrogenase family)